MFLEGETLTLTPGQPATLRLTLANLGPAVDHLSVHVSGIPDGWISGDVTAQLDPGAQAPVTLRVLAPRSPETRAGDYPVTLRARSRQRPSESALAQMRWTVLPFSAFELELAPTRVRAHGPAVYQLTLHNTGNANPRLQLDAEDNMAALHFSFGERQMKLEAGQRATTRLTVTCRQRVFGPDELHSFTVRVIAPETIGDPITVVGQYIHRTLLPSWVPPLGAALLAVLALACVVGLLPKPLFGGLPGYNVFAPAPTFARAATAAQTASATATSTPTSLPTDTPTQTVAANANATAPLVALPSIGAGNSGATNESTGNTVAAQTTTTTHTTPTIALTFTPTPAVVSRIDLAPQARWEESKLLHHGDLVAGATSSQDWAAWANPRITSQP
jgi:hypothetical protein